jgi:glutathione peroxidase-family protein
VAWDFTKFLFDHKGKGVQRFDTAKFPFEMEYVIKKLLTERNQDRLAEITGKKVAE